MRVRKQYVSPRCKFIPVASKSPLMTSTVRTEGLHDVTYGGRAGDEPVGGNAKGRGGAFDDFDGSLWCVTLLLAVASFLMGTLPLRAHDFEAAHTFTYNDEQMTVTLYYEYLKDSNGDAIMVDGKPTVAVTRKLLASGAYQAYSTITAVEVPAEVEYNGTTYKVTSVAEDCFSHASNLTFARLSEGIQRIYKHAFFVYQSKFKTVHIPSTVISLGDNCFGSCTGLTEVIFDNIEQSQLTSINHQAFFGNFSLEEITLPNSLKTINSNLFYDCKNLKKITIAEGGSTYVTCDGALYQLNGDKKPATLILVPLNMDCSSFTLPETVTAIGDNTFDVSTTNTTAYQASVASLTSLDLSHVKTIGNNAFLGRSSLATVTLGDELTSIGNTAFYNCKALTTVALPASLTTLGTNPFVGCTSLTNLSISDENENFTIGEDLVIFNKDKTSLISYPASSTDDTYTVPDGVKTIGAYAFTGNKSLTSVTLPTSLTSINGYAFYQCSNLTALTGLENTAVTTIGSHAFASCSALTGEFKLPSTLTTMGTYICDASGIGSVAIPDGVKTIDTGAFQNCKSLTSVTCGSGVTTIGTMAFSGCSSLTDIQLNEGLKTIQYNAFTNTTSLKQLHIPSTVTSIGSGILSGNKVMEDFTVVEGNTTYKAIDNVLYNKAGTTLIYVAPSNTAEEIHLAADVTTIGANALANLTTMKTLYITSKVTSIGNTAFTGCSNLSSIVLSTATPPAITTTTFSGLNHNVTIYYPISSDEAFRHTTRGEAGKADWGDLDDTTERTSSEEEADNSGKNLFADYNGKKTLSRGYTMILDELYTAEQATDLEQMKDGSLSLVNGGEGGSGIDHGYTWLYRTVAKDTWNTVCLPITLTKQQATEFFGENFEVAEFTSTTYEEDENLYTLHFTTTTDFSGKADNAVVIEANKPYLVWATKARTRDDYYTYTVAGNPVTYATDLSTGYELTEEGAFNLVGTYYPHKLEYKNGEEPSTCPYYYMYDNKIYHASGSGAQYVNGFRAYFELGFAESGDGDGNNARARMGGIALSFDETQQEVATRLEGAEAADLLGIEFPADIYSLDGRMVRSAQQGTQGLSRGIYIKNGKKVVVP